MKLRCNLLLAGLGIFAILLAGCNGDDGNGSGAGAPKTGTTSAASKPTAANPGASGGALGGPSITVANQTCTTNATVAANLYAWYAYEVQAPPDSNVQSAQVCQDATYVCAVLLTNQANLPELEQFVMINYGYHKVGAQALIKAALMVLCSHTGLTYKTIFDRDTDTFITGVSQYVAFSGAPIDSTHFGLFMKNVCAEMAPPHSPQELYPYLTTGAGSSMLLSQIGVASDPVVLKHFVRQATLAGCLSAFGELAGYWGSA